MSSKSGSDKYQGSAIRRGPMAADVLGKNFTQLYNGMLRDPRLKPEDKGNFAIIASNRDGYKVTVKKLAELSDVGVTAVSSSLKRLERYGYLVRVRERGEDGTLGSSFYEITDMPEGLFIGAPAPYSEAQGAGQNQDEDPSRDVGHPHPEDQGEGGPHSEARDVDDPHPDRDVGNPHPGARDVGGQHVGGPHEGEPRPGEPKLDKPVLGNRDTKNTNKEEQQGKKTDSGLSLRSSPAGGGAAEDEAATDTPGERPLTGLVLMAGGASPAPQASRGSGKEMAPEVAMARVFAANWLKWLNDENIPVVSEGKANAFFVLVNMISARLRRGYTPEEIRDAIYGLYQRMDLTVPSAQQLDRELVARRKGKPDGAPVRTAKPSTTTERVRAVDDAYLEALALLERPAGGM